MTPDEGPSAGEAVRPGALSALLVDIVRGPDAERGHAWKRALRPGAVIGRFELLRELGRGGFGVVYEARDRELGRTVAFKAVWAADRPELSEERLLQEAETAARLSHPNIVTLFDVGRSEQGPYLVLELLHGRTLAQRLDQGALPPREALRIGVEVAKALAHAHAHGVVHRDLTPRNVFLCEDGQVKVLDLGMAHAFGHRKLEGGTPEYMAPEQWRGAPEDERTDVFALGVILYRMLAGELPFHGDGGGSVRSSRAAPELDLPDEPALGALVSRMLAKDPVQRPRDACEVLSVLTSLREELERTPSAGTAAPVVRPRRRRRWRRSIAAVAGVLLVAAATTYVVLRSRRPAPVPPDGAAAMPSIAVLPFADLSPQQDQEYFADGVAEEILNALVHVDGLRVAGRSSSFSYKHRNESGAEIGRALHVSAVLEGSVRKAGKRVRIAAELVSTGDGFDLWSQSYERDVADVFAVQDEIAEAVVTALRVKLLPGRTLGAREHLATRPDAYAQYLLGRQLFHLASPEGYRRAVEAYEKALAVDPKYAPAWAGLAVAANYASSFARSGDEFQRFVRRSREAGPRAVEYDPELADGFAARGYTRAVFAHDWAGAEQDLQRAIALNPRDAEIRRLYAFVLQPQGRMTEAIESARLATELDPGAPLAWNSLGVAFLYSGQYARARAPLEEALRLNPDQSFAALNLVTALVVDGDAAKALPIAANIISQNRRLAGLAIVHHSLGHDRESRQALDALVAEFGDRNPLEVASVYAWRGERDQAFAWLERGVAASDREVLISLKGNPLLRGIRSDPRYAALLRRLNLLAD